MLKQLAADVRYAKILALPLKVSFGAVRTLGAVRHGNEVLRNHLVPLMFSRHQFAFSTGGAMLWCTEQGTNELDLAFLFGPGSKMAVAASFHRP